MGDIHCRRVFHAGSDIECGYVFYELAIQCTDDIITVFINYDRIPAGIIDVSFNEFTDVL